MRKFLYKILLFAVLMIAASSTLSLIVDKGLKKSNHPFYKEWNDIYNIAVNADLLIAGSSHARVQISPAIIDSVLNVNSYNIGIDGYPFDLQYARFKIYMEHHPPPTYLVRDIDFETFEKSETPYMTEQFLPYLNDDLLKNTLKNKIIPPYYFYMPFYKYTGHFELIKTGLNELLGFRHYDSKKYKGYEGVDGTWDEDINTLRRENKNLSASLDREMIDQFDSFLSDCQKRNIKVILVACPQYFEYTKLIGKMDQLRTIYKNLSEKYRMPVLDYTNDSLCFDRRYFYGPTHLNKAGSELFTIKLAHDIKNLVK